MNIQSNFSLATFNTFGFGVCAERYVAVESDDEMLTALAMAQESGWPVFVLGGGSNLILTRNIEGLVVHPINQQTHYQPQANGRIRQITQRAGLPPTVFSVAHVNA